MSKTIEVGQMVCKYFIEDEVLKVAEGILEERAGRKKWIAFDDDDIPDESFPGYKNIGRVWVNGEVLYLADRNDELAKKLFTDYCVGAIRDLQNQMDDLGDRITMIRKTNIRSANSRSKCFGELGVYAPVKPKVDNYDTSEFINADQYAERKIEMLKGEMCIELSEVDELHLKSLKTRGAIDACVRAMINKYWD